MLHHAGRIIVVDVWARFPLVVSRVLCGLGGERAEVLGMPCTDVDIHTYT
jgi:hypothetical protein